MESSTLNFFEILMGLLGGLALFLFGMEQMTAAMKFVAGSGIKTLLARMTSNRVKAAFTGAFVTAIVNSSSVTTVLVVGFISAGLMTLTQSMGIIFGANIGSTFTAQLIAFKITSYSLIMIAIGFGMHILSRNEKIKSYGIMLLGLGLLFFGMALMSDATQPLRSYPPFIDLMKQMSTPLWGIAIGALFTAIIQSSGATTGIVIVLASQGFISLEAGIALALGANIGTCVTAFLASLGNPREATQAAIVHILFNILGVVIWVWFIDYLATFVRWVSPHHQELEGLSRLAAETPRQIANAHTLFNIANTLLFIGFTAPLAKVVEYLVPIREESGPQIKPRYLNPTLLETPEVALHHVRLELEGMGQAILPMLDSIPEALFQGSRQELTDIRKLDNTVDTLHSICITFLGQLSKQQLTNEQTEELHDLISIANYIENIGDTIETNMVDLGIERLEQDIRISEGTLQILTPLFASVYQTVDKAIAGLVERDTERAGDIIMAKGEIQHLADDAHSHLATRLTADAPKRVEAFRIETDTIENLRHIYYFAKRIAKCFADTNIRYETDNDE